jgi:phosphatidylinositol glycan class O
VGWTAATLIGRTLLARVVLGGTLVGSYVFWWNIPLNIEVIVDEVLKPEDTVNSPTSAPTRRVTVIGFANSYGSMYLLFLLPFFAVLWTCTQLSGQAALALWIVAIFCYVEVVDSQRDSRALAASFESAPTPEFALDSMEAVLSKSNRAVQHARSPTFAEPTFLSLLAHVLFFATGHQAVLSSIQWKTAFIGFPILTYPWSPLLVSVNTVGPFILCALALPLLATWAISPVQRGRTLVLIDSLRLAVGMQLYFTALLCGTAVSAAILRRHLMVWKVFAPRFMLGAVATLVIDFGLAIGLFIGVMRTAWKVRKVFGTEAV